jgi:hypothetical protein
MTLSWLETHRRFCDPRSDAPALERSDLVSSPGLLCNGLRRRSIVTRNNGMLIPMPQRWNGVIL